MCTPAQSDLRSNLERAIDALARAHALTIDEALERAPRAPGMYAWWLAAPAALPFVPAPSGLLYVGIAPSSPKSGASLRSRLRQHSRGNINASTFRRSLAGLLWERQGWTPFTSSAGRLKLSADHNRALSRWQVTNLRVAWFTTEAPWLIEAAVIEALRPPLNLDHNENHEFWSQMRAARAALAETARHSGGG